MNHITQTTELSKEIRGVGLVVLSAVMYGFMSFLGLRILDDHFSIEAMLFWRFFIAFLWMAIYTKFTHETWTVNKQDVQKLKSPFLVGSLCYGVGSSLYFFAAQLTGSGLAMVIFFSFPMFIAFFTWMKNKKRMDTITLIALIAIFVGLILLKQNYDHTVETAGILFAMGAAFCYAVYIWRSESVMQWIPSSHFSLLICLGCSVMFFIVTMMTHTFAIPHTGRAWMYVFALGIFTTAIPIQLMLMGLKIISSLKASILSVLEPVVTLLVGVILLDESLSLLQTIGVVMVISSAILIQFSQETR